MIDTFRLTAIFWFGFDAIALLQQNVRQWWTNQTKRKSLLAVDILKQCEQPLVYMNYPHEYMDENCKFQ